VPDGKGNRAGPGEVGRPESLHPVKYKTEEDLTGQAGQALICQGFAPTIVSCCYLR